MILLITLEYPPDHGGIATYYSGLVDALPAGSVQVMTPRTHRFFVRWFWPHWLPLLWNAWRVIRREKPSEVWVGQILPIGTAIWLLKSVQGSAFRVQIFCHGLDILAPQRSWWKTWLMRRVLASADRVVANSEFTKQEVVKLGVAAEKVRVVYPCPDHSVQGSAFRVQQLRDQYEFHGKKILLTVARLVQRKGIDLVIEALTKIREQFPDLVYVIVGEGPERKKLELLVTRYSLPVTFIGSVSDAERATWYHACDIFIMTPRQIGGDVEGFGIVYLEAALHGKPVIGSRSGGVPEAIVDGETGILVPENDSVAIAQAITRLLTDKKLADQLGAQGKQRVERDLVWEKQIQKLV